MKQKVNYNFSSQQTEEALKHIPSHMEQELAMLEKAAVDKRFVKSFSYEQKSNMFYLAGSAWGKAITILADLPEPEKLIFIVKKLVPLYKDSAFYAFKAIVDKNNSEIYETYLIRELVALHFCCIVNNLAYLDAVKNSLLRVALNMRDCLGKAEVGLLLLKVANMAREEGCSDISTKLFYELAVYNLKDAYYANSLDLKTSEAYHQALQGFQCGLLATQQVALEVGDTTEYNKCVVQLKEATQELQNFLKMSAISDASASDASSMSLDTSDLSDNSYVKREVYGTEHEEAYTNTVAIEYVTPPRNTLRLRKRF